jgi:hypothetical protein
MIRLTTALLTLGVGMAIATTAIAQPGWWVGCNPEADWCRLLSGGQTHNGHQDMLRQHTTETCTCTCHDTAPAPTEQTRTAAIRERP